MVKVQTCLTNKDVMFLSLREFPTVKNIRHKYCMCR